MSAEFETFEESKKGLSLSPIPVWIIDIDTLNILWANNAGLVFWQAESLAELTQRNLSGRIPASVVIRMQHTIRRIRTGELVVEEWTFYPKGKPMVANLHLQAIVMPDGRLAMLNQAVKIDAEASPSILRALTMVRLSKAPVLFADAQGRILAQSAESICDFGDTTSWIEWLGEPDVANAIIQDALSSDLVEREVEVQTLSGKRIHSIRAHGIRDPVTGDLGLLIQHFDVTERIAAERVAREQFAKMEEQRREILALSTPFLDVGAQTLALPLIGHIDEVRAQEITSRLLEIVANRGIERVIVDITGVVSIETSNLLFLRRLVDAISLLGARPILTGIRSDLARVLASADDGLPGITIKRSLADALRQPGSDKGRRN